MSQKKNLKRRKETGITLIALVVSIVVLLILAGITITFVLGENGIINMAKRAADETNRAMQNEQEYLANVTEQLQNYLSGGSTEEDIDSRIKVSDLIGKPAELNKNIDAKDEYGNKITIPAGFTVVPHSDVKPSDKTEEEWNAEKVEYNYREDHLPCVQDGIVVQDSEGNQFVWIPVGEITNNDGSKTTIDLARYTFDITFDPDTYEITGGTGAIKTKILDGSLLRDENPALNWGGRYIDFLEELASSTTYENSKARDIEGFKTKAKEKDGYYLARYEASQNGEKPMSKTNQDTWADVGQSEASIAAGKMYESSHYTSDLVNSYAWDTTIVFIQTYGGEENRAYSKQTSKNTSYAKTGASGDKVCNIYDMASNRAEWTTETCCFNSFYSWTCRGGESYCPNLHASERSLNPITDSYVTLISFRTVLYVK